MTKTSRHRCWFCDHRGKLTHEHLSPNWLKKYVNTSRPVQTAHRGYLRGFDMAGNRRLIHQKRTAHDGDPYRLRPRIVCADCNNGWMSRLQEQAKPLILPMILGSWRALDVAEQRAVAAWVTMSVMVRETEDRPTATTPRSEREAFRDQQNPLPNWSIWIGKYNSDHAGIFTRSVWIEEGQAALLGPKIASLKNGNQVTGLTMGRLFALAYSGSRNVGGERRAITPAFAAQYGIIPVWPEVFDFAEPNRVLDWLSWQNTTTAIPRSQGLKLEVIAKPNTPFQELTD